MLTLIGPLQNYLQVKIKLKKDAKGSYSWEIQGKDPQEVLKVNETLKKKLGD